MAKGEKQELVKDKVNLPANINLEELAGGGMENVSVKDMSIPFLKILQSLSPEIKKAKAEYIEGAEEGKICNSVTSELFDTLKIVPCFYQFVVNEWKPNRGGYVGTHLDGSPVVAAATRVTTPDGKSVLRSAAGNDLVDTAQWYVLIQNKSGQWSWGVLAFTSTQLKFSRRLLSQLQSLKLEGKNGPFTPPMYAHVLNVSTVPDSNNLGDFFSWKIEMAEEKSYGISEDLFKTAIDYYEQVKNGLVKAVPPAEPAEPEVY